LMRNNLIEIEDPIFGKAKLPTTPIVFSETSTKNPEPPPSVGQHTEEVLKNIVGSQ